MQKTGLQDTELGTDFENALRQRLDYDPNTGKFTWLEPSREDFFTLNAFTSWRSRWAGKTAGKLRPDGYIALTLTVKSRTTSVLAHRAAWFVCYGEWPPAQIDHINGDRSDNRLSNLRAVTPQENRKNSRQRPDSLTGVSGVTWSSHAKRWLVRISVRGRQKNCGYYLRFEDAVRARKDAEAKYGYHENHGRTPRTTAEQAQKYIREMESTRLRHSTCSPP